MTIQKSDNPQETPYDPDFSSPEQQVCWDCTGVRSVWLVRRVCLPLEGGRERRRTTEHTVARTHSTREREQTRQSRDPGRYTLRRERRKGGERGRGREREKRASE